MSDSPLHLIDALLTELKLTRKALRGLVNAIEGGGDDGSRYKAAKRVLARKLPK